MAKFYGLSLCAETQRERERERIENLGLDMFLEFRLLYLRAVIHITVIPKRKRQLHLKGYFQRVSFPSIVTSIGRFGHPIAGADD